MSRGGIFLAVIFIVVLGLFGFFQSSFFRLSELEVEGIDLLNAEEVRLLLDVGGGQHLYSISTGDLERRLAEDPRVATAEVTRHVPGRLVVLIRERQPVAAVIEGGVFALVDSEGTVLSVHGDWPGTSVPVLSGVHLDALDLGESLDAPGMDELLRCTELLGDLRYRISQIVREEGYMSLHTTGAEHVMFPLRDDEMKQAVSMLESILEGTRTEAGSTIDLRVPDRPVIRHPK